MRGITPTYDYLVGFPSTLHNKMKVAGHEAVIWGIDSTEYTNNMTTGVILESASLLYGPKDPESPNRYRLRPMDRLMWSKEPGPKYYFEGSIQEGLLPKGTLVVCMPKWEQFSYRPDNELNAYFAKEYPGLIPSFAPPKTIMAYCNESTGWQWRGYAGWVMVENAGNPWELKSDTLELVHSAQPKTIARRVLGYGHNLETCRLFRPEEVILMPLWRGVETRLSAHFPKTKNPGEIVAFVNGTAIFATMEKFSIKPEDNLLLIRSDEPEKRLSKNVVVIEQQQERPERGTILAVGPMCPKHHKPGARVMYRERFGMVIPTENEKDALIMMRSTDVFGILEPSDEGYSIK